RLAQLVSELMDVSRISEGRLQLHRDEVDLAELVRDVARRFSDDASKAGCAVSLHVEGATRGQWDQLRIEQVVTNLLTNALKFGAGRPVELVISGSEGRARVAVRDHGIGVAPEDAERIFARFERASAARMFGGLGLGLYIVRQIVEAHGGHVRVESAPGEGSMFTVDLPCQPPRL